MKATNYILYMLMAILTVYCNSKTQGTQVAVTERNKEAREDSIKLSTAYEAQSKIESVVFPKVETDPVQEDPSEDAADDPAIWYNEKYPSESLVFGTNKKSGVHAYALNGENRKFYPLGKVNNIDIRQKVKVGQRSIDILGGSNRSDNSIIIYAIDSTGLLTNLISQNFLIDTTDIDEVYGFCMYKDISGAGYAIVNGKNGKINQYKVVQDGEAIGLELIHSWKLNSQPEGMVADDELGVLYIGEEEQGIWKLSLLEPDQEITLLKESNRDMNPNIEYDIEGLAIYHGEYEKDGFLLASIQGSFSYAVFDRMDNSYLGSFIIGATERIDGVEETDGLDLYMSDFGAPFSSGIVVVQDGFNYDDSVMVGQNFKIIALQEVVQLVDSLRKSVNI